jgi:hypothetical protein
MGEHNIKLREKAIAAYEASDLKKVDVENDKKAFTLIRQFLLTFGVNVEVNSNPFEVDGIRFYVDPLKDTDGIWLQRYGFSQMRPL